MTVRSFFNVNPPGLTKALPRYFDLAANGTGFTTTLMCTYTDEEVAAAGLVNGDANLSLYRNSGSGWVPQGGVVDAGANKITLANVTGFSLWAMRDSTDTLLVSVPDDQSQPVEFTLHQNYPNPFNPTTNFEFGIRQLQFVSLRICDVLGREVATIVNRTLPAGTYTRSWDANGIAGGVFFYRLEVGKASVVKKLVILK